MLVILFFKTRDDFNGFLKSYPVMFYMTYTYYDYVINSYLSNSMIFVLVVTCPAVPHANYSTVDTELATYGSQPNYTCIAGNQFPDGNRTKAIVCEDDGQWNTTVPDCQGDGLIFVITS